MNLLFENHYTLIIGKFTRTIFCSISRYLALSIFSNYHQTSEIQKKKILIILSKIFFQISPKSSYDLLPNFNEHHYKDFLPSTFLSYFREMNSLKIFIFIFNSYQGFMFANVFLGKISFWEATEVCDILRMWKFAEEMSFIKIRVVSNQVWQIWIILSIFEQILCLVVKHKLL